MKTSGNLTKPTISIYFLAYTLRNAPQTALAASHGRCERLLRFPRKSREAASRKSRCPWPRALGWCANSLNTFTLSHLPLVLKHRNLQGVSSSSLPESAVGAWHCQRRRRSRPMTADLIAAARHLGLTDGHEVKSMRSTSKSLAAGATSWHDP